MSSSKKTINSRFTTRSPSKEKINSLANRAPFLGDKTTHITKEEKSDIMLILRKYQVGNRDILKDLDRISDITSELKSISTQAILLHGERIKWVQNMFKKYKDGAFTKWLIKTYGNRQTPYNFMLYYGFLKQISPALHNKAIGMPKQIIYSLASRQVEQNAKESFIISYSGETKEKILKKLRDQFPINNGDKRTSNSTYNILKSIKQSIDLLMSSKHKPTKSEIKAIKNIFHELSDIISNL